MIRSTSTLLPLLFLFILIPMIGLGQAGVTTKYAKKRAQQLYEEASYAAAYGKVKETEQKLLEAVSVEPGFLNAHFQLGDLYLGFTKELEKAESHFAKVIELDPTFRHQAYYKHGMVLFALGDTKLAKTQLQKYLEMERIPDELAKQAELFIKNCAFVEQAEPSGIVVKNMGEAINSHHAEYFPAITGDQRFIYFTYQEKDQKLPQEDIYYSEQKKGVWSPKQPLNGKVNTAGNNEGAHTISPDGQYLIFTACNLPEGFGSCDLYFSKREGNQWGEPKNMGPIINTEGWESQPSISADSRSLYFVARRRSGFGGADIYVSHVDETGYFGKPENLGAQINTYFDEERPFIHPDGRTLYFSSEGHVGYGNSDVYVSKMDAEGKWQEPINFGSPVNSFGYESGIFISTDGNMAYYAAEHEDSYGDLDIYSFELPSFARPEQVTYISGRILDKLDGKGIEAKVKLFDLESGEHLSTVLSDAKNGEFLITVPAGKDYAYNVGKEGYLFFSENIPLKMEGGDKPISLNIELEKIQTGRKVVLRNIFFDTGEFSLKEESKTEISLVKDLMDMNPTMTIELGGHTDNVGGKESNQLLSENRAKAVQKELVDMGVDAARISAKGYGMDQPIADNATAEGRALNRRTEFTITGE